MAPTRPCRSLKVTPALLIFAAAIFVWPGNPRAESPGEFESGPSPQVQNDTVGKGSGSAVKTEADALSKPTAPAIASPTSAADSNQQELTIEIDPAQSRNAHKSLPLAMLYSVALPGAGEWYLQEKSSAKVFLLAEAGFWASLYVAFLAKDSYLQSARNYASEFAGIDASGKSQGFLETMANYRSYQEKQHRQDSYELAQILSGKRDGNYDIQAVPDNYWDFGTSANPENTRNWNTFQATLRYYRASKVAVSFALGALALNRVVSVANTLHVFKKTSARNLSLNVWPEFGPGLAGATVTAGF